MEGPGQTVVGNLPALRQGGLEGVLHVILGKAVHGQADGLVNSVGPGSQGIPVFGIGAVGVHELVVKGIAVFGQVLLGLFLEGAGTGQLVPHGLQGLAVGDLQQLVGENGVLKTVAVAAPHNRGNGAGDNVGDAVTAAVTVVGEQHAALQQLGLRNSVQGKHLVVVVQDGLGLEERLVVVSQNSVVHHAVLIGNRLEPLGLRRGSRVVVLRGGSVGVLVAVCGRRVVVSAAGGQAQQHNQRES